MTNYCGMIFSRVSLLVAGMAVCICVARGQTETGAAKLVGDWTGESICVGEIGSCHDETVVYHISLDASDPTKVKMGADKIVNGKPESMGDIDLKYDAKNNTLTGDLTSPRYRGIWEFTVKEYIMWGTLSLLPEKRIVRQIRVTRNDPNHGPIAMTNHATGTFEVKLTPQDDKSEDKMLGRMSINKQWRGEIDGSSTGQMLTGGDVNTGSAGYVAMEKFTGTVKGRKGTFILQHSATMTKGKGDLTITVVPDSGTDDLKGIRGKLTIRIENGKHFYDLEYSLSP
jgi:hypothetical protein